MGSFGWRVVGVGVEVVMLFAGGEAGVRSGGCRWRGKGRGW